MCVACTPSILGFLSPHLDHELPQGFHFQYLVFSISLPQKLGLIQALYCEYLVLMFYGFHLPLNYALYLLLVHRYYCILQIFSFNSLDLKFLEVTAFKLTMLRAELRKICIYIKRHKMTAWRAKGQKSEDLGSRPCISQVTTLHYMGNGIHSNTLIITVTC